MAVRRAVGEHRAVQRALRPEHGSYPLAPLSHRGTQFVQSILALRHRILLARTRRPDLVRTCAGQVDPGTSVDVEYSWREARSLSPTRKTSTQRAD